MAASAGAGGRVLGVLVSLAVAAASLAAQESPSIQDNSFLIEEAYNQERGIVQHISTFSRHEQGDTWMYTFTQEWPVGGYRHQVSYMVPLLRVQDGGAGLGDVAFNYRYQLVGHSNASFLIAPRATVLLPTGSEAKGRGSGGIGAQFNLPVTYAALPWLTAHTNAGVTTTQLATTVNLGASAVWLARPSFNVLLEGLWVSEDGGESAFLSPGIRWAFDFESGLQVVPGLAYTVGIGPSRGDDALFFYLSFEHPFRRR